MAWYWWNYNHGTHERHKIIFPPSNSPNVSLSIFLSGGVAFSHLPKRNRMANIVIDRRKRVIANPSFIVHLKEVFEPSYFRKINIFRAFFWKLNTKPTYSFLALA
jgi:hypothetical protein